MQIYRFSGEGNLTVSLMNTFVRKLEEFILKNLPFAGKKTYTYKWERQYAED